jgi:hypothetical protein
LADSEARETIGFSAYPHGMVDVMTIRGGEHGQAVVIGDETAFTEFVARSSP